MRWLFPKPHHAWLLAIVLIGTWLRFQGLGARSLWLDEALSWRLTQFPPAEMLKRTADAHTTQPPLYFLLLRGWEAVWGESEFALRSLAAAAGVLAIAAMYAFVTRLAAPPASEPALPPERARVGALLAAALVALSPLQIHVSQQVRGYSLGAALFAASGWALFAALARQQRVARGWCLYGALALALCYTQHVGLIAVFAQLLCALSCAAGMDRRQRGAALMTAAAIAACYLPWLSATVAQSETARVAWHTAPFRLETLFGALRMAFLQTPSERMEPEVWMDYGVAIFWVALQAALAARRDAAGRFLLLTGLLPVAFLVAWSCLSPRVIVAPRYLTFAHLAWLAGIGLVVGQLKFAAERRLAAVWLAGALALACYEAWPAIGPDASPGIRAAVASVLARRAADEPIVVCDPFDFFEVDYYCRGRARPRLLVRDDDRDKLRGASHLREDDLITSEALSRERVTGAWLLSSKSYDSSATVPFDVPTNWAREETDVFTRDHYLEQQLTVSHYTSRGQE